MLVLAAAAQADAGIGRQRGEQVFDRQEEFDRGKHRTLSVVTPVAVPVPGVRPERLGRIVDVLGEHDDRAAREVVEQSGGLLEEQRQVVFDARRPASLTDFPVDRAPRRITLEAPSPRTPKRGHRIRRGGELLGRKQIDAIDPSSGTLGVGVEAAKAFDFVIEQIDTQRCAGTHREQIEQRAAHRVLAVLHHLADACVSGPVEPLAQGVDVDAVSRLDPEPVTVDESARSNSPHRGGDHRDQYPRRERRQARRGFESFGDDVLVRREEVVG